MNIHGPHPAHCLFLKIMFYWHIVMPPFANHLWLFWATLEEVSHCDTDHIAIKPRIQLSVPLK